jgi:Cobalamin-independent synthase, N-terminal domain.
VKKAVEAYWAGKITYADLTKAAADVKKLNWTNVKAKGVDFVPRCVSKLSIQGLIDLPLCLYQW